MHYGVIFLICCFSLEGSAKNSRPDIDPYFLAGQTYLSWKALQKKLTFYVKQFLIERIQ
jgi:hypothetical protein